MSHLVFGLNPTVLAKRTNTSTDRVAEEQRGRTRTRRIDWSRKATVSIESERTMLFAIFPAEVCLAETATVLSRAESCALGRAGAVLPASRSPGVWLAPYAASCDMVAVVPIGTGALLFATLSKGFILAGLFAERPCVPCGTGAVSRNRVTGATWKGFKPGGKVFNVTLLAEALEETILAPVSPWTATL